jgi:serine/threonine protein kinase
MDPGTILEGENGTYKIVEPIGKGGMGCVFRALDETSGEMVAVKTLPDEGPDLSMRFRREVKALRSLAHPNMVRYRDGGTVQGRPFVVTDLIHGRSLAHTVGMIDVEELREVAEKWGRELAAALAKAHELGILHRDMKPANVMIDRDGNAILIDFGLAKVDGATAITGENEVLGTLAYIAPETYDGHRATPATDVYGWGLVMYELLNGARPYADYDAVHAAHLRRVGIRPLEIPGPLARLAELVDRCLTPDPTKRPADGKSLLEWFVPAPVPAPVPVPAPPAAAPVAPKSKADPTVIAGWKMIRRIGKGGMGTVFEARNASSGERVAIKLIAADQLSSQAARDRFDREAKLLAALDSPRVVRVLDFGHHDGRPYFVMQYLEGDTLTALIKKRAPMKAAAALDLMIPIAEGVAELHQRGILHRDLKPSNVMVTSTGPRLVDFGLARDAHDGHLTKPGEFVGTMEYAAPEILRGQTARPASDVYALGLIMVELLVGDRAGRRPDLADALREGLGRDPAMDGAAGVVVRENLIAAMTRAANADPLARPADAGALLKLLRQAKQDLARVRGGTPSAPVSVPPQPPAKPRTSPLTWLVLALVLAGAVGLLWFVAQMMRRAGL